MDVAEYGAILSVLALARLLACTFAGYGAIAFFFLFPRRRSCLVVLAEPPPLPPLLCDPSRGRFAQRTKANPWRAIFNASGRSSVSAWVGWRSAARREDVPTRSGDATDATFCRGTVRRDEILSCSIIFHEESGENAERKRKKRAVELLSRFASWESSNSHCSTLCNRTCPRIPFVSLRFYSTLVPF